MLSVNNPHVLEIALMYKADGVKYEANARSWTQIKRMPWDEGEELSAFVERAQMHKFPVNIVYTSIGLVH